MTDSVDEFSEYYPFALDGFQVRACRALAHGPGGSAVLVCAPTGAGKTVVGEFAVHLALVSGQRCFYTTPIKALSNQKYNDLVARHGAEKIGLLTGDNTVNGDAPVVVMTTEVLRNMLYVGSAALDGLGYVVMDEVHYLGDRFRGAVWEEVIIHLAGQVRLVALSATVSNAEEFGEWLVAVRGHTEVIVHEQRPVPLWQHLLVGDRLFDLLDSAGDGHDGAAVDPQLKRYLNERTRHLEPGGARRHGPGRNRRDVPGRAGHPRPRGWRPAYRPDVVTRLERDGLLPAITFIFSRAGCDAAVRQCRRAGLWLTSEDEQDEIEAYVDERSAGLRAEDLEVLDFWNFRDALRRGLAAHHAGMLPVFKETVEALFVRGLVRAVFATETLALGINMPARTVLLERLSKFNGQAHAEITPGEYTQLTGRAGRRGIDVEGHAVVLWTPDVEPERVAGLASTRTYPLRSSFRPSYNMAVNLVGQLGRDAARGLLDSSFAQFQADRGATGLIAQIRRNKRVQHELAGQSRCRLGEFSEYAGIRRALSEREAQLARAAAHHRKAEVLSSLERLRRGDVIRVPSGRRAGLAVVVDPGAHPRGEPRPLVVTDRRWGGRLSPVDFPVAAEVLGRIRVPKNVNHRSPQQRRDLASSLRTLDVGDAPRRRRSARVANEDDAELARLRDELRAHPCHSCPEREAHARLAERHARLARENDELRRRAEGRTGSLARTFDRICQLLEQRQYLHGDQATPVGRALARIWSESDLLMTECLRAGAWDGLTPAELAAVVSTLVYEARREDTPPQQMPSQALRDACAATGRIWSGLVDDERRLGLSPTREPDPGFVAAIHHWASGQSLAQCVYVADEAGTPLAAGDFIRWSKQVIDLLGQLAAAPAPVDGPTPTELTPVDGPAPTAPPGPPAPTARTALAALDVVRRGVVAQSMQI